MGRANRGAEELFYGEELENDLPPSNADPVFFSGRGEDSTYSEENLQEITETELEGPDLLLLLRNNSDVYTEQAVWRDRRITRFGNWLLLEVLLPDKSDWAYDSYEEFIDEDEAKEELRTMIMS